MNSWTPDTCGRLVEVAGDTLRPGGVELSEQLLSFGSFQANSRVLDAGCGMGATLRYLAQTRRLTAVGVDSSAAMLAAARSHSRETPLVNAALEKLPFVDASFDRVICECVLSQTDVTSVLAELQRVVRMDGLLLVTDLFRRPVAPSLAADPATIDQLATREQTETMLKDAGFTMEHWEDRTRELQHLAVRLIMSPGSARENLFGWRGEGCVVGGTETGIGSRDLGYHLLVARRVAR